MGSPALGSCSVAKSGEAASTVATGLDRVDAIAKATNGSIRGSVGRKRTGVGSPPQECFAVYSEDLGGFGLHRPHLPCKSALWFAKTRSRELLYLRRMSVTGRPRRSRTYDKNEFSFIAQFHDAADGKERMSYAEFLKATGCKSHTFASKLFACMDPDKSGDISLQKYLEGIQKLLSDDMDERIHYVFSILDLDGDGSITGADLKSVLTASVEGENPEQTENEGNQLAQALMQICDKDSDSVIGYEEFVHVMKLYPDLLKGLTFGRCGLRTVAPSRVVKKKKFRWVRKAASWVVNNPQILFTYTSAVLLVMGCFMWSFLKYAGDCTEVDMKARDPVTGYSREDVLHLVQESSHMYLQSDDEKYMVFSKAMAEHDPVECRDARKRKLLSWGLPIAKGCGQAMKAAFTLILFPVSRNLMTALRTTFLKRFFFFDGAIEFHRFLGAVGFWLGWVHSIAHIADFVYWQHPTQFKEWSWAFPEEKDVFDMKGVKHDDVHVPMRDENDRLVFDEEMKDGLPMMFLNAEQQTNTQEIFTHPVVATGVALIAIYTIAALFAFNYPKKLNIFKKRVDDENCGHFRKWMVAVGRFLNNFNNFWYTHHLFAVFYIVLLFHPMPYLPDGEREEWGWSDCWLWVGVPLLIFVAERVVRVKRGIRKTRLESAELLPGNVVGLRFLRPRGFRYTPGQYVFIRCQQISRFEWHPFTLTTSPDDACLSVHVRKAGDWTTALHDLVAKTGTRDPNSRNRVSYDAHRPRRDIEEGLHDKEADAEESDSVDDFEFSVSVDGPYGAPAQCYDDYKVIVLIGAGIGVTPFASVLSDLLDSLKRSACVKCGHCNAHSMPKRVRKVYFYWTVRSQSEATWFRSLLEAISVRDEEGLLDINIHITGTAEVVSLRRMVCTLTRLETGDASVAHSRVVTRFGRIQWPDVFEKVQQDFPKEPTVGVFFCGPNTIAKILSKMCRMNSKGLTKFNFMQESFGST